MNVPRYSEPLTDRAMRFAVAIGMAAAAALTAGPLLGSVVLREVGARPAAQGPSPLTGQWHTFANGDRVNRVARSGDAIWVAADGGGLVHWNLETETYRQYLAPQDGLASNEVYDVLIDGDGVVWAATGKGLSRLNPSDHSVTTYTPENTPSMPTRVVTALADARDGSMYVGFSQEWDPLALHPRTQRPGVFKTGGLARFHPGTETFDSLVNAELDGNPQNQRYKTIPSENITALAMGQNVLWVGTRPFFQWDSNYCPPGEQCGTQTGFWVEVGGGLAGMEILERDGMRTEKWRNWSPGAESSCYSTQITTITIDDADRAWIGTMGKGLHVMINGINGGGCTGGQVYFVRPRPLPTGPVPGLKGNHVYAVDIDDQGRVWIGHGDGTDTGQGIAVLDHNNTFGHPLRPWEAANVDDLWLFFDVDEEPGSTHTLISVIDARDPGLKIIGTRNKRKGDGEGLRLFREFPVSWRPLRTADTGIPSNHVTEVAVHPQTGDMWFSFEARGVARFDGQEWQRWRAFQAGSQATVVTTNVAANFRRLPVDFPDRPACDASFPASQPWLRVGDDPTLYRLTRCLVAQGLVYIEVSPDLRRPAPNGTPVYMVDRGPPSDSGTQISFGPDGDVWVGGRKTIWTVGRTPGSRCPTFPNCWLDGGLGRFDGESWFVYDEFNFQPPDVIPDQEVQAVEVDGDGKVWVGTGNPHKPVAHGIGVLDPGTGKWTYYHGRVQSAFRAWVTGVADFAIDPASGEMYTALHAAEVCIRSSPFGGGDCSQTRRMGGGVGRWNGATWTFWAKTTGASIKAFGEPVRRDEGGELRSIIVDRGRRLVWVGAFDADPTNFHWNTGRGINATLNWCVARELDAVTPTPGPTGTAEPTPTLSLSDPRPTATPNFDPNAVDCAGASWTHKLWANDGQVAALALDHDNNLWAGTHRSGKGVIPPEAGVKMFDSSDWWTLTPRNTDLVSNEIMALAAVPAKRQMWVGTRLHGVSRYLDEIPATPTPSPTRTATPLEPATSTNTVEATSTAEGATVVPTRTPDVPPTGGNPRCEPGDRCYLAQLPIVLQYNPRPQAPVTFTPTPPATATRTPVSTATATATATTSGPLATATPTATATGVGGSPTVTQVPGSATSTATSTTTPVPTQPALKSWSIYDNTAGAIPNIDLYDVYGIDKDHVWLVGYERIYFWDGQRFYQQTPLPPQASGKILRTVQFVSVAHGFAAGDGVFLETRNGGVNWRNVNTGNLTDNWRGLGLLSVPGGVRGWVLGNSNGHRVYFDGITWSASTQDRNTRHRYSGAAMVTESRAYAIRDDGSGARIFEWNGGSWQAGPSTGALNDMHVPAPNRGVAVGDRGIMWSLGDSGWALNPNGPRTGGRTLRAVHMVGATHIWAAGERTVLYGWDGFEWHAPLLQARNRDINGLWIDPTGTEGWAVGSGGLVLRYR